MLNKKACGVHVEPVVESRVVIRWRLWGFLFGQKEANRTKSGPSAVLTSWSTQMTEICDKYWQTYYQWDMEIWKNTNGLQQRERGEGEGGRHSSVTEGSPTRERRGTGIWSQPTQILCNFLCIYLMFSPSIFPKPWTSPFKYLDLR